MDYNIIENQPIFIKIEKFGRFIKNQLVQFEILKKFEIKILKKL
jgi:hypothetical protein